MQSIYIYIIFFFPILFCRNIATTKATFQSANNKRKKNKRIEKDYKIYIYISKGNLLFLEQSNQSSQRAT